MITRLLFASVCLTLSLVPSSAESKEFQGMKVILAPSTFTPDALKELQPIAEQVAQVVDKIIPGTPPDYPPEGIVCFEAPGRWSTPAYREMGYAVPPVTINGPRVVDEPQETVSNTVRIVVSGVQAPDKWKFVLQLSHELAHVKMGVRTDNYLDETFAVAFSFEVLRRFGYEGYLLENEGILLHQLPLAPQKALALEQWKEVQAYWLDN